MALNLLKLSILFFLLSIVNPLFPFVEPRTLKASENPFTKTLQNLNGVHKGQKVKGLCEIKSYLQKLGYLSNSNSSDDNFDENLEFALKHYQSFHHLQATGEFNDETIKTMSLPRCGMPDINPNPNPTLNHMAAPENYTFFPGSPRWRKRLLTYKFSSSATPVISMNDARIAMQNALRKWSDVTNFTFREITGFFNPADIVAGFHRGFHGDGNPFDGRGGVLAHAFAPEDGRMHYDADEQWSSNGITGIDHETVVLHESGHMLGLGHSSDPNAVMAPTYSRVRRELAPDDVNGIRALYST